jgi:ABC-type sulfate transport system substrate-binding protein
MWLQPVSFCTGVLHPAKDSTRGFERVMIQLKLVTWARFPAFLLHKMVQLRGSIARMLDTSYLNFLLTSLTPRIVALWHRTNNQLCFVHFFTIDEHGRIAAFMGEESITDQRKRSAE